jgi:hypothetical protein
MKLRGISPRYVIVGALMLILFWLHRPWQESPPPSASKHRIPLIPLDFSTSDKLLAEAGRNPNAPSAHYMEKTEWGTRKPPPRHWRTHVVPPNRDNSLAAEYALKWHDHETAKHPDLYQRFSKPHSLKPPTGLDKPDAVVVYLTNKESQKINGDHSLSASLVLLFRNFINYHQYPVILFHSGFYTLEKQKELFQWVKEINQERPMKMELVNFESLVHFVELNFTYFPPGFPPSPEYRPKIWDGGYPGYQHMISFWFRHVFIVRFLEQ